MKEKEFIDHEGIIKDIDPYFITVEIVNKSACAACHAKGACSLGDTQVKEIEVENSYGNLFEIGEIVSVKLKKTLGFKALWISYLIPLIILVLLLLSLSAAKLSEPVIGLTIIGFIALYYIGVWIFKSKLKQEFLFTVEKL